MNTEKLRERDTDCGPDMYGALAQLAAQPVVDRKVTGSNPVRPAKRHFDEMTPEVI